jgi:hypothetical protein
VLLEQFAGSFGASLGHDHRFRLALGVPDVAFGVQPVKRIPVMRFSGTVARPVVERGQIEQRQLVFKFGEWEGAEAILLLSIGTHEEVY